MDNKDLVFLPIRCAKTKNEFYLRYDRAYDGVWNLTRAEKTLPSDVSVAKNLSSVTLDISGARLGPQYKCPDCGSISYVRCGQCQKLTCYDGSGKFTCAYCGNSGEVSGYIDTLDGEATSGQ